MPSVGGPARSQLAVDVNITALPLSHGAISKRTALMYCRLPLIKVQLYLWVSKARGCLKVRMVGSCLSNVSGEGFGEFRI